MVYNSISMVKLPHHDSSNMKTISAGSKHGMQFMKGSGAGSVLLRTAGGGAGSSYMDMDDYIATTGINPYTRAGVVQGRGLSKGEISLGLNFYACVRDAVENSYAKIIVLESDIWLRNNFIECLNDLLVDLKEKDWDFVSLGEGVGTRPANAPKSYYSKTKAYAPPHSWVYRCTDSMMFQLPYLQKLVKTFIPLFKFSTRNDSKKPFMANLDAE